LNRDQKAAAIAEIAANIEQADAVFVVDYRGISVGQAKELRTRLRAADARFNVVKNTLGERAADQAGAEALKEHLKGPTALTYVTGDAAAAAKALREYARETDLLPFKGGYINGQGLSAEDIGAISRLPSRDVLYAQLVGIVAHPIAGLARTLNQLIGGLAIALGQIEEQGLVPQAGASAAAAPAAPAEAEADDPVDAVPTEAGNEPTDADEGPGGSAGGAQVPAEGAVVVGDESPDQDAGPASGPEPAQTDQAEGDDAPAQTPTEE